MDSNKEDHNYTGNHWTSSYAAALVNSSTSSDYGSAVAVSSSLPEAVDSLQNFDARLLQQIKAQHAVESGLLQPWQLQSIRPQTRYDHHQHYYFQLGGKSLQPPVNHPAASQAQPFGFPFLETQFHENETTSSSMPALGDGGATSSRQSLYSSQGRAAHGARGDHHDQNAQRVSSSFKQMKPRSYTKVLKLGSIGRSLNIARFNSYAELRSELARMFGLEGQLDQSSHWQLVYMDNDGDILLVGDDRWEEFVSSVRGIRIISPSEVAIYTSEEYAGTPLSTCLTKTLNMP
ncbi:hypothetical protein SELMODRAFT_438333 [Selaginella moellendorffii]|uniref:Auxin-responsive protein n=1 Tax=Selaginella moellendorffii TaxID=88036 RepID=D8QW73_SELML|nr:auxin response factor 11 [Selaginella moellendorffii]XP_024520183.1 auxin response factor 11 [Selaginella moellendorffii]EFJ36585.1 hypothetical protein SELMODRAFT_438333 [Selaginella moellendorffii]|eukprot:XP_002963122.1 auxin response factor 11 [Selaginella moellendorffii]